MKLRKTLLEDESPEHVFIQRYRWLLGWALRLTDQQHEDAEDLLQTAFVQLALRRPGPEDIRNLDGYFYALLRNLRLSQIRRASQAPKDSLTILDFDSADLGLRALDPRTLQRAHDDLRAVCRYACLRKATSKTASVLLLRFFHGYYPSEIARLMRTTPAAVSEWLRRARAEAKAYLLDPASLRVMSPPDRGNNGGPLAAERAAEPSSPFAAGHAGGADPEATAGESDVLQELLGVIFTSAQGPCPTRDEVKALYRRQPPDTIAAATLAHFVSCRRCLEIASREAGVEEMSGRDPFDSIGPQERPPSAGPGSPSGPSGPSGASGAAAGGGMRGDRRTPRDGDRSGARAGDGRRGRGRPRRHPVRQVVEHEPCELRIAVNGFMIGSLAVGSGHHELSLTMNGSETPAFLEVFSEQGLQLLYADPTLPPEGAPSQSFDVRLSQGRRLLARFDFSAPWPTVTLSYDDPRPAYSPEAAHALVAEDAEEASLNAAAVAAQDAAFAAAAGGTTATAQPLQARRGPRWPRPAWPGAWSQPWARLRSWLHRPRRPGTRTPRAGFSRGQWVPATLAIVCFLLVSGIIENATRRVSAAELLASTRTREAALIASPSVVVHRVVSLEERRLPQRTLQRRQRIDVWQSAARGVTARRVFDDRDRLVAGEWIDRDGKRTVYTAGHDARTERDRPRALPASPEAWRLDLSAEAFERLVGDARAATARVRGDEIVIHYEPARAEADGDASDVRVGLVAATLTLSKSAARSVSQVIVARDDDGWREYLLSEVTLEQWRAADVPDERFTPDATLLPARPAPAVMAPIVTAPRSEPHASPAPPVNDAALDQLELDATYRLHRLGDCVAFDAAADRAAGGVVRVQGRLTGSQCEDEVARVFGPVRTRPDLDLRLDGRTANPMEPAAAVDLQGRAITGVFEARFGEAPAAAAVPGAAPPAESSRAQSITRWALDQQKKLDGHAARLARLIDRWPADRLARLDLDTRTIWQQMVRDEAEQLARSAHDLNTMLGAALWPDAPAPAAQASGGSSGAGTIDLSSVAQRARDLVEASRNAAQQLDAVLAVPRGDALPRDAGAPAFPLPTAPLAASLSRVQRLATGFADVWVLDEGPGHMQ